MTKKGILIEEHSVSDLFKKLDDIHKIQQQSLAQQKLTNGRVTKIESLKIEKWIENQKHNSEEIKSVQNKSIGAYISNHPYQFAFLCVIFFALVISDFRQPIIEFLINKIV